MAKKNPDKSPFSITTKAEREGSIQKKLDELNSLQVGLVGLDKKGKKVDNLIKTIEAFIFEINNENGSLKKFINDPSVFAGKLVKVTKEMGKIKYDIEELKTEVPEAAEEQKQKDVKELEVIAATEDIEFKKFENHYFDAEKELEEFKARADKHEMDVDESELAELGKILDKMKSLLKNKDYKKMDEARDDFKNRLGDLHLILNRMIDEDKQDESAAKSPVKPAELQSVDAEKEKKEQRKQRKRLFDKHDQNFLLLTNIIKEADKKEQRKRNLYSKYDEQMTSLLDDLNTADKMHDDLEIFNASMDNFDKNFSELVANLEPDIKEIFEHGGILPKKAKPHAEPKSPKSPKPPEPIADDLETQNRDAAERVLTLKSLHASLDALLELYREKSEGKYADIVKEFYDTMEGLKVRMIPEIWHNKGKEFDEEAKFIQAEIDGVSKDIQDNIKKAVEKEKEEAIATKRKADEDALKAWLENPPPPRAEAPQPPEQPEPPETQETPEPTAPPVAPKSSERKKRVVDIKENDLLEIIGEKKLQEVVNEIILGNIDVAGILLKDIFSRKDLDEAALKKTLAGFDYTPDEFKKAWVENLHKHSFEMIKKWVEQMSRNWLNKNINLWDKFKENPAAHLKLAAINILPFAVLGGSVGLLLSTGGASSAVRGAAVGGATGLLRGLKNKVDGIRGWFNKRKENANQEISVGKEKIKEEKSLNLRDSLLAQFTGEEGPQMLEQLSAMLSQSLRDASASAVKNEDITKVKANAEVALEEVAGQIDKEFAEVKISSGEESAIEIKRSQTERVEVLIKKLYEDKDLEALIQELINRDPKIVKKLQNLTIYGQEFSKFVKDADKDPVKKESSARKIASVLGSVAAGASIGAALAAAPELRALLGAAAGGYLGVKYGHLKDRKAREMQFEKEFKNNIAKAEKLVETWAQRQKTENAGEFKPENMAELAESAKDLRVPLTLGMLEGDINLKLRAQNVLRRVESLQINIYLNEAPQLDEVPAPENLRHSAVENLLTGLNEDLESLTTEQQNIKQRILRKPGWWRAVGYGVVGAVAGAGLGYGTAKLQEYLRGDHKQSSHPAGEEGLEPKQMASGEVSSSVVPVEVASSFSVDQFALEHKLSPEAAAALSNLAQEYPELNNPDSVQNILNSSQVGGGVRSHYSFIKGHIDTLDEGGGERRQVIFEELLKKGGPESAAKYLQSQDFSERHLSYLSKYIDKDTPAQYLKFARQYDEEDNKMVRGLFRAMQGRESTDLANAGLEVDATDAKPGIDNHVRGEVNYFGLENNQPILSGSGSVTVDQMSTGIHHETAAVLPGAEPVATEPKFVLSEHTTLERTSPLEAAKEVSAKSGAELMTDYPPEAKINAPAPTRVEKTLNTISAKTSAVETKTSAVSVGAKGSAGIETAAAPAEDVRVSANEFLRERGSSPREFINTYDKMVDATIEKFNNSFVFRGDSEIILQKKIDFLYNNQPDLIFEKLSSHEITGSENLRIIEKVLAVEEKFNTYKPDWMSDFRDVMFKKEDKVIDLVMIEGREVLREPVLTNGGHAARIWDPVEGEDIFIHDKDWIFNTNEKGELLMTDQYGVTRKFTHQEAIKLSDEQWEDLNKLKDITGR